MTSGNEQQFTNNTGYSRRSNKLKNEQINISKAESDKYTPISELPINAKVEPSDRAVSEV